MIRRDSASDKSCDSETICTRSLVVSLLVLLLLLLLLLPLPLLRLLLSLVLLLASWSGEDDEEAEEEDEDEGDTVSASDCGEDQKKDARDESWDRELPQR